MPLETDPIDLLLDTATDDLVVGSDLQLSTGVAAVAQGIRVRIQTFKGEGFLNLDEGVPYWQNILGQKYDQKTIHQAFRAPILATPGVAYIISLSSTWDGATRTLTVSWKAMTEFGETVEDSLPIAA